VRVTDIGLCRILRAQRGPTLKEINFSGCKNLSDETIQRVVNRAPLVEILDLTRCPLVSDAGLQLVLECLDHLKVLRLYAMAQLSAKAFKSLQRQTALQELDLCGCRIEDDSLVAFLDAAAPSPLHTLNLTWCPALTDATAVSISKSCPRLIWLSLFGNTNISKVALETLAASPCGLHLNSLDVRGLTQAGEYSTDSRNLKRLFPSVIEHELHH